MTEDELIQAMSRPPMTETELWLSTLTNEELDDAAWFMRLWFDRWLEWRRLAERDRVEPREYAHAGGGWRGTDGPVHAIRALDLAIIRERMIRAGAEPWDAHQSADDHPARAMIVWARERLELNPDQGSIPRLNAAGVLEVACPSCGQAKPLTIVFWRWLGSMLDTFCRACREAGEREARAVTRQALIADEERQAAPAHVAWTDPVDDVVSEVLL